MKNICISCGNNKFIIDKIATSILALPNPYNVVRCKNCRLMWISPGFTEKEIDLIYKGDYFTGDYDHKCDDFFPGIEKTGISYQDIYVTCRLEKFNEVITKLLQYNSKGKYLLDIGAATGEFMLEAQKFNLKAFGIEISKEAVEMAKSSNGLNIENTNIDNYKTDKKFDFIHLNHVFEHLLDPENNLKKFNELLNKTGVLYIEIPFQFHIVEKIRYLIGKSGDQKFTLHSVHHPFFYNPRSLKKLLNKKGFKVLSIKVFHKNRYSYSRIKCILWYILSKFKIGNYIEVYAIKA